LISPLVRLSGEWFERQNATRECHRTSKELQKAILHTASLRKMFSKNRAASEGGDWGEAVSYSAVGRAASACFSGSSNQNGVGNKNHRRKFRKFSAAPFTSSSFICERVSRNERSWRRQRGVLVFCAAASNTLRGIGFNAYLIGGIEEH